MNSLQKLLGTAYLNGRFQRAAVAEMGALEEFYHARAIDIRRITIGMHSIL